MNVSLLLKHDHSTGQCSYHLGAHGAATTAPIELKKDESISLILDNSTWQDAKIESVRIYRPRPGESDHHADYENGLVGEIIRDEDLLMAEGGYNQVQPIKDRGKHIYDLELYRGPQLAFIYNRETVAQGQHTYHFGTQVSMGGKVYDSDPEMQNKPDKRRRLKKLVKGLTLQLMKKR